MAQYEESQIEFAIMALVKDPLLTHIAALAGNIKSINVMDQMLLRARLLNDMNADKIVHQLHPEGLEARLGSGNEHCLKTPDLKLGVTQAHIDSAMIPEMTDSVPTNATIDVMLSKYDELVKEQSALKMAVQAEMQDRAHEQHEAATRARDFGALMQKFALKVKTMEASRSEKH